MTEDYDDDSNIFATDVSLDTIKSNHDQTVILDFINRKTNSSNYKGFKSSGNITYIKNKSLKSEILKYYEQDVRSLEHHEENYNNQMEKVMDHGLSQKWSFEKVQLLPADIQKNCY